MKITHLTLLYHFLDPQTKPCGHFFKCHIYLHWLLLVVIHIDFYLRFLPVKMLFAYILNLDVIFCALTHSTTLQVSFEQVDDSFTISSFDGSSKPVAISLAFGTCCLSFFFHTVNPFNMQWFLFCIGYLFINTFPGV